MSPVAAVVVRRAETLPVVRNPSHATYRSCCDAVITYASPTYRPPPESRPPPSVEECGGPRLRCSTPCSRSAVHRRKNASVLAFPPVFHLFSKCLEHDGFPPPHGGCERGLSAKQMPLSDPRETEEMVYSAMSSAPPIRFQGKSDAQLQALHCSELVISLGRVKRGMTMRGVADTRVRYTKKARGEI